MKIDVKIPRKTLDQLKNYPRFYQKVWLACATIPQGQVRTYGWIAKRIGSPRAARAVGMALAANPFAPVIPCHRVVRSDGGLGGYSAPGGLDRKRKMLLEEKARNFEFPLKKRSVLGHI